MTSSYHFMKYKLHHYSLHSRVKASTYASWIFSDCSRIILHVLKSIAYSLHNILERKLQFKLKQAAGILCGQQASQVSINRGRLTSPKPRTYNTKQSSLKCKYSSLTKFFTNKQALALSLYLGS
jgi:hypothetical protein